MQTQLQPVLETLESIVLGKPHELRLALACLLARGHLLIEDLPGVGKTTLARALANLFGFAHTRIQFTSDLLPADILGVSVFETGNGRFRFHPGPIFAGLVLADEVNRASPRAQSALLEAMEEQQVTLDGHTRPLPEPFFVIATQNPSEQVGTYPLPESQLDRFLMRLSLGYPAPEAERSLLAGPARRELIDSQPALLRPEELRALQDAAAAVHTAPALIDYLMALVQASREHAQLRHGLSPRAGLALRSAARAWAFLDGRSAVIPEDLQAVFVAVVGHRLVPTDHIGQGVGAGSGAVGERLAQELLRDVAIP
jgi:MoxR-like ATPases